MSGSTTTTGADSLKPRVIVQDSTRSNSELQGLREENEASSTVVDITGDGSRMGKVKGPPTPPGESDLEPNPDIESDDDSPHPRYMSSGTTPPLAVGTRTRSPTPTWSPLTPPNSIGRLETRGLHRNHAMIFSWPELDRETSDEGSSALESDRASEPDLEEGGSKSKARTGSELRGAEEENKAEIALSSQKRPAAQSESETSEKILDPVPKRRKLNQPAEKTATRTASRAVRPRKSDRNIPPTPPSTPPQPRRLRPGKPKRL